MKLTVLEMMLNSCVCCVLGMTLNSSVIVQGTTVKLAIERVDEAVSGEKPPAGKGVDSMACTLNLYLMHFVRCNMVMVSPNTSNQIIIIIIWSTRKMLSWKKH